MTKFSIEPSIPCATIGKKRVERLDGGRALMVDRFFLYFTPTEYRLLKPLLSGMPISDSDLAREALGNEQVDKWVRENLDKHIDNMRSKLRLVGIDIYRVLRFNGYLIGEVQEAQMYA